MKKCVVVIPLYKEHPEKSEIASFRQCLTILKLHDISVVTYQNLNLAEYHAVSKEIGKHFDIQYFHQDYFKSVQGYNKLCLTFSFYERFIDYEYMLIYQTDAWVFRDELDYWCDKGYDYIGAPFFEAIQDGLYSFDMSGVGNGGLSLRKIQYCTKVLKLNPRRLSLAISFLINQYIQLCKHHIKFKRWYMKLYAVCACIVKMCGYHNTLDYFLKKTKTNEDYIFGIFIKGTKKINVNIPDCIEAMQFSFEVHPEFLYNKNEGELPFGCHAYLKWDYNNFWAKYINC